MSHGTWQDTCGICGSTKFWPSSSGYKICYGCTPDPLAALIVLARRGSVGAIRRAERWAGVEADRGALQP